jgi:hypothetical protein
MIPRNTHVSLQVAIMKVLASYPGGRASVAEIKSDLAILAGAGATWTDRLKHLAARQPDLDIFGQGFVVRTDEGWNLTVAGREMLIEIERPRFDPGTAALPKLEATAATDVPPSRVRKTDLVGRRRLRRRPIAIRRSA